MLAYVFGIKRVVRIWLHIGSRSSGRQGSDLLRPESKAIFIRAGSETPKLQKDQCQVPCAITHKAIAASRQRPCLSYALMYSSARFAPPVKATLPSMEAIFR